tara:strand:+ start:513 stop:692 length:180 start_codon:yes stop_codon:yes gene_type:complete
MNYKKGDTVFLNDSGVIRKAVVSKDGIDNKGRVKVKPDGFPFELSVTTKINNKLYVKTN